MLLRNTHSHRIYYVDPDSGERRYVGPGRTFEGSASDAKRPGLERVDEDEATAETRGTEDDGSQVVSEVAALGQAVSTSALRDRIDDAGHREPGTGLTRKANQASAGGPSGPDLPPPETAEPATVTSGAPGHEVTGNRSAADLLGDATPALDDAASNAAENADVPSYGEGVKFASAGAENKADELVAAGKLDADDLEANGGSGKGDAYTVADVEALADDE